MPVNPDNVAATTMRQIMNLRFRAIVPQSRCFKCLYMMGHSRGLDKSAGLWLF